MFTRNFLRQTGERALKTLAQTLLAIVGVSGLGILDVNWAQAGSVAALATLASVLTSIVSVGAGEPSDPALLARVED